MPHECHKALAVTGAVALATACVTPGTVAAALVGTVAAPQTVTFSHQSGQIAVTLASGPEARVQRTARRIFEGAVFARRAHLPLPLPLAA